MIKLGVPKESTTIDPRVALAPSTIKKLSKLGLEVIVEKSAGEACYFLDSMYEEAGARIGTKEEVFGADLVYKIHPPDSSEIPLFKKGAFLFGLLDPYNPDGVLKSLQAQNINAVSLELIPRTSRAQSMDVLSSQANIAGYRAVLESTIHYPRFIPMMMTSAGMAKPAKVAILGAGVAGLQAIATAKRLGAKVEAFDIRSEVKEQIESLGAKFMDLGLEEEGSGEGGYAKELSEEGKKKQQKALEDKLKTYDIIVSTANIPGRRAPVLITEEAVKGMNAGSVIIDMAAANGGNCPLTSPDEVKVVHDVVIVGWTNYPAKVAADSSLFFGNNLVSLTSLFFHPKEDGGFEFKVDLEDDIIEAALAVYNGEKRKGS